MLLLSSSADTCDPPDSLHHRLLKLHEGISGPGVLRGLDIQTKTLTSTLFSDIMKFTAEAPQDVVERVHHNPDGVVARRLLLGGKWSWNSILLQVGVVAKVVH